MMPYTDDRPQGRHARQFRDGVLSLGIVLLVGIASAAVGAWVWFKVDRPVPQADKVVQVQLVRPPPTPPPPPPPPPPPDEQVQLPDPEQVPEIAEPNLEPPGDAGVDGPIGEDAFGQQRGSGGGGNGGAYSLAAHQQWYAQKARDRIRGLLARRAGIRKGTYKLPIRLWIDEGGKLLRFELLKSSGDADVDREIQAALADFGQMPERRPQQLPPFRVRVEYRA